MAKKKLIIFDLDGVLIDSHNIVNDFILESYPSLTLDLLKEIFTDNMREGIDVIKKSYPVRVETPEEKEIRTGSFRNKKSSSPLYPGIAPLLQELRKNNCILAINTNAKVHNCLPILEKLGISSYFDYVLTAADSNNKAEKLKIIIVKSGCDKDEAVFITDTLGDLREADEVGVKTIAVTYGVHDRSYFTRERHDNLIAIVDTVEELGNLLIKN